MPDREKVMEGLKCHINRDCCECPYREGWKTCNFEALWVDALALLEEQDEIVRCKDCMHGELHEYTGYYFCKKASGEEITHKPDWFCASGERRDADA